jgi:hypothetical protein
MRAAAASPLDALVLAVAAFVVSDDTIVPRALTL